MFIQSCQAPSPPPCLPPILKDDYVSRIRSKSQESFLHARCPFPICCEIVAFPPPSVGFRRVELRGFWVLRSGRRARISARRSSVWSQAGMRPIET